MSTASLVMMLTTVITVTVVTAYFLIRVLIAPKETDDES